MEYRKQSNKAWALVSELFKNRVHLDGKPYTENLPRLVGKVFQLRQYIYEEIKFKYQTVVILRDILEDTPYTEKMLRMDYTADIADAVVALTRIKGQSYWEYILQVLKNDLACNVKFAVLEDNTESLPKNKPKELRRYKEALKAIKQHLDGKQSNC
jgi:(p)ppGpp synthase/HD superfamily hydrolase